MTHVFDKDYFHGGGKVGGYANEGYWDYPCLPTGELIIAEDGLRAIETLREGEKVLTHNGRFRKIVEVMSKKYEGLVVSINPRYAPTVRLTPEHPILVVDIQRKFKNWKPEVVSAPRWLPAGSVDPKLHMLVIPKPTSVKKSRQNKNLLRLVGYYLAEGSVYATKRGGGGVSFAFHKKETAYISNVRSLMRTVFGSASGYISTRKNCSSISFYSPKANAAFSKLGTNSYNKNIKSSMLELDDDCIAALLIGLYRGDGSLTHRKQLRFNTVSKSMAVMVRLLLLKLDIVSGLRWRKPRKKKAYIDGRLIKSKGIWEVCVTGADYSKLAKVLKLRSQQQNRTWKLTEKSYTYYTSDDRYVYVPIRSVAQKHYRGDVFNFEVAQDHSYTHPGAALHNCHHATFQKVMEYEPESVLELGCARSYVLKRLEDAGVRVQGLEISEHCRLTRVIENVTTWDITKTPWPVADKAFDLCLSIAVLEHIPEDKLAAVFAEMERTCKRGLHGIDLHDDDRFDQTHCTIRPQAFWDERLPKDHIGVDKEVLEPKQIVLPSGDGVKLNLGSFTTMFHYGWKNLDIIDLTPWAKHNGYKFSQWDARQGLPYDDGIVDLIFACHMLEHFTYEDGAKLLAECHRALKPGGVMRILVPDAMKLIAGYVKGSLVEFDEMSSTAAARGTQAEKLYELLCAEHKSICDAEKLVAACKAAGFASAKEMPFRKSSSPVMQRETMDLYPDLSLIVEATR